MSVSENDLYPFLEAIFYRNTVLQLQKNVLVVSDEGKILEANKIAVITYGYSADEIRNMYLRDLSPPRACNGFYPKTGATCRNNILIRTFHKRCNGDVFPVEIVQLRFHLPHLKGAVLVIRDISCAIADGRAQQENIRPFGNENAGLSDEGYLYHLMANKKQSGYLFDIYDLLATTANSIANLFCADSSMICLLEENGTSIILKAGTGCFCEITECLTARSGLMGKVYESGKIAAVSDYKIWEQRLPYQVLDKLHYTAVVPLKKNEKIIGMLGIGFYQEWRTMDKDALGLLQGAADIAAVVLTKLGHMPEGLFSSNTQNADEADEAVPEGQSCCCKQKYDSGFVLPESSHGSISLFDCLLNGVAFYEAVNSENGGPVKYRLISVNSSFENLTGLNNHMIVGKTSRQIFSSVEPNRFDAYGKVAFSGHPLSFWEYSRRFDCYYDVDVYCPEFGIAAVSLMDRIDGAAHDRDYAEHIPDYDSLTGLPNRCLFMEHLRESMSFAAQSNKRAAVIMLGLDDYKFINNFLGHAAADEMLKEMSRRLEDAIKKDGFAGFFMNDELVLFALLSNNEEDFSQLVQKLNLSLDTAWHYENKTYYLKSKFGISIFPDNSCDADVLVRQADVALCNSRKQNKSFFQYYDWDMEKQVLMCSQMEIELRKAIKEQQFVVHYQPQVDFAGRVASVEALIRWEHPDRGLVMPLDFIPFAEENGMMIEIGGWVLQEVCRQIQKWQADGLDYFSVAVNISACQFQHADLLQLISEALGNLCLDPGRLIVEITETAVMKDINYTIQVLSALRSMGVQVAIDDFGTGYSSLTYLNKFPVTSLKIDRSFIQDICADNDAALIVRAIVELAKKLNYVIVAEGVETEEQLQFLKDVHCDLMQGYLFSKPLPSAEIYKFLREAKC